MFLSTLTFKRQILLILQVDMTSNKRDNDGYLELKAFLNLMVNYPIMWGGRRKETNFVNYGCKKVCSTYREQFEEIIDETLNEIHVGEKW